MWQIFKNATLKEHAPLRSCH